MMEAKLLEPNRVLGAFESPSGNHSIHMVVSRTGLTVAAKLNGVNGRTIARAEDLASPEPIIRFEDFYNANAKEWKDELRARFREGLRSAMGESVPSPVSAEASA
jgi:hypothetical protein